MLNTLVFEDSYDEVMAEGLKEELEKSRRVFEIGEEMSLSI
jgi:hypothetical protein